MSLLAGALVLVLAVVLASHYLRQLRSISRFVKIGPVFPLLGNALQFLNVPPEEMLPTYLEMMRKDPELRKVAAIMGTNRIVVVFHPETVESLLSSNAHVRKSMSYDLMVPWLGTGLLISTGEKWRQRRKLLTPAFHFKILEESMRIFNKNTDTLSELLLQDGQDGQKVLNLFPYLSRCTLDIILESAMGTTLDIQNNRNSEYAQSISKIAHVIQKRQHAPWLWPDWIYNLTETKRLQDRYLKTLHGFTQKVIQERREELLQEAQESIATKKKKLAFLDLLLTIKTAEGQGLSDQDIQEEVDIFMFGGHDSTACSISWTLLLLANHPEMQDKIMEEQYDIFGDDPDADVTQEQLSQMKYLECCIKESLRLYPSVPILGRQLEEDEEEDELVVDGIPVPGGSSVIVVTTMLHRNPKVWEEPDEFRPERFLAGSSSEVDRHPYAFIPFSAGPRNCIGQRFAMMEEKAVLSKLLRKVEVIASDRVEDVKPVIEIVTSPKGGVKAVFKPRRRNT